MDQQLNWKKDKRVTALIDKINEIIEVNNRCILAIEGRAAAGKTTMAGFLKEQLDVAMIHMDDFFLPQELRTKERYVKPGGNIHYERFNKEVATQIELHQAFSYRRFNCKKMQLDIWHQVEDKKIIIIEGTYATHPNIKVNYDIRLFMDVAQDEQENRILHRNGPEQFKQFLDKWIPLEEIYFKSYDVREHCDLILKLT